MIQSFRTVFGLSIISLISLTPLMFISDEFNVNKVDIYLFYDKLRYPENIAYDIAEIFNVTFFIYLIWRLVPSKRYKKYVFCFLISSVISIIGYFLFYAQYISLLQVPMLVGMMTYVYLKQNNEKRDNAG